MDFATIIGLAAGFGMILLAILSGAGAEVFLHIPSLGIVIGGTIAASLIYFPLGSVLGVVTIMKNTILYKLPNIRVEIDRMVNYVNIVRREGLLALEDKLAEVKDPFLAKGLRLVIDGFPPEAVRQILGIELDYLQERHKNGKTILETMGAAAPAFGMIGTLIGLVQMLQQLEDPSQIGAGMAVALLTTFYGAIAANLVFLPLAGKLEARDKEESLLRSAMIEGVLSIQAGDKPFVIQEKLKSFVSPKVRKLVES